MNRISKYQSLFLVLSAIGFAGINLPFLYFALIDRAVYFAAMDNQMALLFIVEAFLVTAFIAFLIAKLDMKKPGWIFFICMSLLGSLAFSIPFQLYMASRNHNKTSEQGDAEEAV